MEVNFSVFIYIIVSLSVILIYKVFKGPTIVDRLMAADSIDLLLGVSIAAYGAVEKVNFYVDLGIIVVLLGFISTVLICKYLEGDL